MAVAPQELGVVKVASPCKRSWDAMTGDDQVRFCSDCRMNVYNLSQMSAEEARELMLQKEGRLCVRFFLRADGTALTRDCPKGVLRARRTLGASLALAAAALAAPMLMPFGASCRLPGPGGTADLIQSVRELYARARVMVGLSAPVSPPVMMGAIARVPAALPGGVPAAGDPGDQD